MGGLMVLIAIALFTGLCWLISGWIIRNKAGKHYGIKRGAVFLIPALMPVYIQIVEYVLFQQACKDAVVYFPEKKLKAPETLITDDSSYENQGRYFDGMFKYIVSPHYSNNRPVDLTRNKEQFNDYIVYPYKSKPMEGNDKQRILEEMRYLLVRSPALELETWYSYSSDIYIYDFVENRKVSQVIPVFPQSYQRSILGFFHARFKECPNKDDFNFGYQDIVKNTFVMENKDE